MKSYLINDESTPARLSDVPQCRHQAETALMAKLRPADLLDYQHELFDIARAKGWGIETALRDGLEKGLSVHRVAESIERSIIKFDEQRNEVYRKYWLKTQA